MFIITRRWFKKLFIITRRWFKNCLDCKNLDDKAKSVRLKTADSEIMLQARQVTLRVSGEIDISISQSSVVSHFHNFGKKSIQSCQIVHHITKTLQNFWLDLLHQGYPNKGLPLDAFYLDFKMTFDMVSYFHNVRNNSLSPLLYCTFRGNFGWYFIIFTQPLRSGRIWHKVRFFF